MAQLYTALITPTDRVDIGYDNFYNDNRERDICNTPIYEYNCFGFAFQVFVWGSPLWGECHHEIMCDDCYDNEEIEEYDSMLYSNIRNYTLEDDVEDAYNRVYFDYEYDKDYAINMAVDNMLGTFPDLRLINSLDELQDDEYGIIYAAGGYDFHYVVYYSGIGFFHKMGSGEIEQIETPTHGFGDRYTSRWVLFAKKKH